MRLSRVLGGMGRTFIAAGVIILLFVAYQLWGTGIQHARAQSALQDDFQELVSQAPADFLRDEEPAADPPEAEQASAEQAASEQAEAEPAAADTLTEAELRMLYRDEGEAIARLEIPQIGVEEVVVEGVRVDDLRKGPGHYRSTPLPGQAGNAAIAGHRTTYGAPFHRIDELNPGDEFTVQTIQGTFTYRVLPQADGKGHFIVSPSATEVLGQDFTEAPNRLTLTACHPKYSARQRIIVVAELVGEPAPTPSSPVPVTEEVIASEDVSEAAPPAAEEAPAAPETAPAEVPASEAVPAEEAGAAADMEAPAGNTEVEVTAVQAAAFGEADTFGEGLNGDPDAIPPAVAWGLAAGAVWLMAWYVGTKWRKWPSYGAAFAPFMILLFVTFVHIDQAIPSY